MIYVPTIVLVEFGEAVRAGRVKLGQPFRAWMDTLLDGGPYLAFDLTVEVAHAAEGFTGIPERGDRLIAATAPVLDCPLMTRDPEIAASAEVEPL